MPLDASLNASNVAYAAYDGGKLARMALLNMEIYNLTTSNGTRPSNMFTFDAPEDVNSAEVTRLTAPEATSNSSITFGGYSYDYDKAMGKPVKVGNGTSTVEAQDGKFSIEVAASEAVIVSLK